MKYAFSFLLFFMFSFCTSVKGQDKTDLTKNNIKPGTGEVITSTGPKRVSRTITQDRNGNIWIAAHDGVFRYDGRSFTNMTSKVTSARFFSVLEDRKGNLWFSSPDSGIYYYDGKSFQNFATGQELVNYQVPCIYEDKTDNIWFGTASGARRYDGKSFRNYMMNEASPVIPGNDDNVVYSIIEDKTGKFWFGTKGNACIYDGKKFTVLTHNGEPFRNVRTMIEDRKGNIWLGGYDGLWRYDGRTFIHYTKDPVGYIYEDKKGNIWTSSQSANGRWALLRYDQKSLSDKKPTVKDIMAKDEDNKGMIFGILEAYDGSIWFGAVDGVYRYDGNTIKDFK